MGTTTTNFGLYKPARGEKNWGINGWNINADIIDSTLKDHDDAITALQTSSIAAAFQNRVGLNKALNTSFEKATAGDSTLAASWLVEPHNNHIAGDLSRALDTTDKVMGNQSQRLTIVTPKAVVAELGLSMFNAHATLTQSISLHPSTTYTASAWGKAQALDIPSNVQIQWRVGVIIKNGGSIVQVSTSLPQTNTTFARASVTFVTRSNPTDTHTFFLMCESQTSGGSKGSVWFDAVQIEQAPEMTFYSSLTEDGTNLRYSGNMITDGSLTLSGNLSVSGNTVLGDNPTIDTLIANVLTATFIDNVNIGGDLAITGSSSIPNTSLLVVPSSDPGVSTNGSMYWDNGAQILYVWSTASYVPIQSLVGPIDADTLDSLDSTQFLRRDISQTTNGPNYTFLGDNAKITIRASVTDEGIGNIPQIAVQNSASVNKFTVDEDGDIVANSATLDSASLTTNLTTAGLQIKRTAVIGALYSILHTDHVIGVNFAGLVTLTLPTAIGNTGRTFIIKDESGAAGTNNITINTSGGQTIDGVTSVSITADYGVIRLYSDGANWFSY